MSTDLGFGRLSPVVCALDNGEQTLMLGEPTASPHLWITPVPDATGYSGTFSLTHAPTGMAVTFAGDWRGLDLDDLRALAAHLAELDWSFTTPADIPAHYAEAISTAIGRDLVVGLDTADPVGGAR